ncbi:unnamed protein product [Closterium sp. NIES-54]
MSICTCTRMGCHLATFTRWPGSSLYTQATEPPQVAVSPQVSVSGSVAPPCSCRLLSPQTLLWHHYLGHTSLPRVRGMYSCLLVSGLPRSLPPLPPSPAPPCLPCVEGLQPATPHSSSFPTTTAPLQTLHMDVRGPAGVSGQGRERYFLLVVDDYTRYTTVFPLRSKGEVLDVFIPWIYAVRLHLLEQFHHDLLVLRLHSDGGGEFSSDLLRDFFMEVARTSMIHAAAPHFLWPFAVRYAAHQLNFLHRVSLPENLLTLRWTGEVGDASVFRVWGSCAFIRDTSADKLSARAIPCDLTFDELVPFYRLFPYRSAPPPPPPLFLTPGPPPIDPLPLQGPTPSGVSQVDPLPGTVPVEVAVDSGAARGTASGGAASGGAELGGVEPGGTEPGGVEPGGAESEGAGSRGAEPWGAEPGGAEPAGVESRGAQPKGVEPKDVEPGGAESGGAEPRGTASSGGPEGASPRLSPGPEPLSLQQLGEWFAQRTRLQSGAAGAGDYAAGDTGAGGARVTARAGGIGGAAPAGPGAAGTGSVGGAGAGDSPEPGAAGAGGTGAGGTSAGGAGAGGVGAVAPGAGGARAGGAVSGGTGAGGTMRLRPYFVSLLQQVLGVPSSTGLTPPLLCPPPDQSQPLSYPASPLPAPSPYPDQTCGLTKHRKPASRPGSPVCTGHRVPRLRPPPVPGTHAMALRPSSVPLPPPPESSLPVIPDPESDLARAASPTVSHLLATVVTDHCSFESTAASALVAELVDFAAACRLE